MDNVLHYIIEVAIGITVAAIVGTVSALVANARGRRKERQRIKKASLIYVNRLEELINIAFNEGVDEAKLNARAIVSTRNSIAGSLISVSSTLNSEIDRLAAETGEPMLRKGELINDASFGVSNEAIYDTIQVLHKVWPARRSQMIVEIRKLLAELGLNLDATDEEAPPSQTPMKVQSAGSNGG